MKNKLILIVLVFQISIDAKSEAPIIQPGAPGESSKILDPDMASDIAGSSYIHADIIFLQGMIIHHKQAILMSKLAKNRTNNKTFLI